MCKTPAKAKASSTAFEIIALAVVPSVLFACAYFQIAQSALLSIFVALIAVVIFFIRFEKSSPALRQVMPTVVLSALAVAGRLLFAPIPNFKPVTAICIISGAVFGRSSGFMVGAMAALVSNFFFGQGPWTVWQMYCWGLCGYFAAILAEKGMFDFKFGLVSYGAFSSMICGVFLNCWHAIGFVQPFSLGALATAIFMGLPFDIINACATVLFLLVLYAPWYKKMHRVKLKYDILGD